MKIVWEGNTIRRDLDGMILKEVRELDIPDTRDLIFHTIWLGDDYRGPSIGLSGDPRTGDIIAEYFEHTRLVNL